MATKVVMEALSPTMEEGRLVKWLKNEGDAVKNGETLAEVETDKAIMDLVARGEGVLRKRLIDEGATAPVGQLIAVIASADENIDAPVSGAAAPAAGAPAAAAPAAAAPPASVVAQTRESAGATSVPRSPRESQGEASTPPQQKTAAAPPSRVAVESSPPNANNRPAVAGDGGRAKSSPLARRLASERGLDLGGIQGSGPGGRIIKRDIEAAPTAPQPAARVAAAPSEGDFRDVPLTQIRKTIARRLAESLGPIPTFYLTVELDVERVAEMRSAMAELGDEYKVSFNDIVMKAVAVALSQHHEVNAHWLGDKIRYFNRVHLGMAVAVEDGLITPVIFDADQKGMRE